MKTTYPAILSGEKLTWLGERPELTEPVRVTVDIETSIDSSAANGVEIAKLMAEISKHNPFAGIGDPVEWQRREREDRPLPGRE